MTKAERLNLQRCIRIIQPEKVLHKPKTKKERQQERIGYKQEFPFSFEQNKKGAYQWKAPFERRIVRD